MRTHPTRSPVRGQRILNGLGILGNDRQQHLRRPFWRAMSLLPVLTESRDKPNAPENSAWVIFKRRRISPTSMRGIIVTRTAVVSPLMAANASLAPWRISSPTVERVCFAMSNALFCIGLESL